MQQTLKRLSLIQTSIELDDTDTIALQVSKLESLEPDDEVKSILQRIEALEYASALLAAPADRFVQLADLSSYSN